MVQAFPRQIAEPRKVGPFAARQLSSSRCQASRPRHYHPRVTDNNGDGKRNLTRTQPLKFWPEASPSSIQVGGITFCNPVLTTEFLVWLSWMCPPSRGELNKRTIARVESSRNVNMKRTFRFLPAASWTSHGPSNVRG